VRYDIYGADVSIANKMESNGVEGNVMVSEATKLVMERDKSLPYRFEWKRDVDSKSSEKPIPGFILYEDHKINVD
jgi:class 3 adenylate cyclase